MEIESLLVTLGVYNEVSICYFLDSTITPGSNVASLSLVRAVSCNILRRASQRSAATVAATARQAATEIGMTTASLPFDTAASDSNKEGGGDLAPPMVGATGGDGAGGSLI